MPFTSSYRLTKEGNISKDRACFAETRNAEYVELIIEKTKFSIERPLIEEYLNDLMKFFTFTWSFDEEHERYVIKCNKVPKGDVRILFGMFIRFIWEGWYSQKSQDHFYKILPIYNQYKKYYKKRSRLELLLVCCNWFTQYGVQKTHMFNGNHFPVNNRNMCKLHIDDIVGNRHSINTTMGLPFVAYDKPVLEMRTKKDYCDFYNFVKANT